MTATPVLATADHAEELQRLQKILRCYQGFQLILALYNDPPDYRNRLIALLNQPFAHSALLDARSLPDFSTFEDRLSASAVEADIIHVIGLDAWLLDEYREQRLQSFNLRRENIAHCCVKPLVLWLPGYLVQAFALQAPDCWEWRRAVVDFCYLPELPLEKANFSFDTVRAQLAYLERRLERLPPLDYQHADALAVFNDEVTLEALAKLMDWPLDVAQSLAASLVKVDLAKDQGFNHFSLESGLCAYLRLRMDAQTLVEIQERWRQVMVDFIHDLASQRVLYPEQINSLSSLEWPNFSALLEQWQQIGTCNAIIEFCSALYSLLQFTGKPERLARISQIRNQAEQDLSPVWSHARFLVRLDRIQNILETGQIQTALRQAENLLTVALQAGATAYRNADYDIALAYYLLGNILSRGGLAEAALEQLQRAQQAFQVLADTGNQGAILMVSTTLTDQGNCLTALGRLEAAIDIYQQALELAEKAQAIRSMAVDKVQLAYVHFLQEDYQAALAAYTEAKDLFSQLNEPPTLARILHQVGMVYSEMQAFEQAEQAYRQALAIFTRLDDRAGAANSLSQLGNLYGSLGKLEPAVMFYRQAADSYTQLGDKHYEGMVRSSLASSLIQLHRYTEARRELQQAIACNKTFGFSAQSWKTWDILFQLEQADHNPTAAHAAKQQAIQSYLAYRRDGGENIDRQTLTLLCQAVFKAIGENSSAELLSYFKNQADLPDYLKPAIPKLIAISQGERNPNLADDPELDYNSAAELLLLLEQL